MYLQRLKDYWDGRRPFPIKVNYLSPQQVNLKISHHILPNPKILEDDLPILA